MAGRVKGLAKIDKRASRLYKTGCKPQGLFGASALGLAPAQRAAARRICMTCLPGGGVKPCNTTLIAWRLGPTEDPEVCIQIDHIRTWMQIWKAAPAPERREISRA